MIHLFEKHLNQSNLAENTQSAYLFAVKQYHKKFDQLSKINLQRYKVFLIENYKPQTVNLRLRAINYYLEFIKKKNGNYPLLKFNKNHFWKM